MSAAFSAAAPASFPRPTLPNNAKDRAFRSKYAFFGASPRSPAAGIFFSGRASPRSPAGSKVVRAVVDVTEPLVSEVVAFPPDLPRMELDVVAESEVRGKGFMGLRKTKLVCTVGPACCSLEALERLARGGMTVVRLNMCHNTREWHRDVIRKVKRLNEEMGYCVSVMIDTEGSQVHMVDVGGASSVKTEDGSVWLFTTEKFEGSRPYTIQANYEGFAEGIVVGDELVIDGGMATFEVIENVGKDLKCRCVDSGLLFPRAKLTFWRDGEIVGENFELPTISTKDWADIDFGISEGVDYIAVSFVKDASDIKLLKNYLSSKSLDSIGVLAKIESLESLDNLVDIVKTSDGIMFARGDLGVQVSLEQIPSIQEKVTQVCREMNKPIIVASQLLESMVEYPTPTRAEVADVSEAVRQYADALMLSGESAIGAYGEKALAVLRTASERMELWSREENQRHRLSQHLLGESLPDLVAEQISKCSVEMANKLGVDAIFVYTTNGSMPSLLSRNRPNSPIFAFTQKDSTRKCLNLKWGVIPITIELSSDMEDNISNSFELMKARGLFKDGDVVLVVSDIPTTNTVPSICQSIKMRTIA